MKRSLIVLALCVSNSTWAQDPSPATTGIARAANAPCWISLDNKRNGTTFGVDTYDAASIKGFHKVTGTGIVNVVIAGSVLYNFPIDTGSVGHQDDYINRMRLRIAACFGDTTEGLGIGIPTQ